MEIPAAEPPELSEVSEDQCVCTVDRVSGPRVNLQACSPGTDDLPGIPTHLAPPRR